LTNRKMNLLCLCSLTLTVLFSALSAQAKTTDTSVIIKKVINAYGGKTLTDAYSLKITDHNKGPWPGESENPGLPEIWRINEELTIDFKQKRKSLLSYRVPRTTIDLERWIFEDGKATKYDILHQKYSYEDWVTYNNLGGSIVRSSDTMQAKRLNDELKEAKYLGEEYFRGKAHQKLDVTFKSGASFIYYIDKTSGLIRKAHRYHPRAELVYVFSNHRVSDGLTYASDMNFFVNGELRLTSVKRNIELNPDLNFAFSHYDDYQPWGKVINSDSMVAKQLTKGIYQAGQGRSKTVFVEQADHFVAVGGSGGIKANYAEMKKLSKSDKPLKYFVVTHHHRSNLRGLNNVIELGAKLVIANEHKTAVLEALSESNAKKELVLVPDRKPFKLGNLRLTDIPTAHSQHYLLVYSPENKMIIAEDHYETDLKIGKPRVYKDMVLFSNVLESLKIDVEKLVDIRSWRQYNIDEFTQWVNDFTTKSCPPGYKICSNG